MELNSKKIRISTVILGPTRTKLLSKENKLKVISISKEKAARSIYKLLYNHKDIVYVPKFSLIIKLILSLVPEYIFKRFNF